MSDVRFRTPTAWMLRVGWALTALFGVHAFTQFGGETGDAVFRLGIYHLVLVVAAVAIVVRAVSVPHERVAWSLFALALASWTVADSYYSVALAELEVVPVPSIADVLWLAFYPLVYLALILLVRSRVEGLRRGMWLDGVVAAFAVGAVSAAVLLEIVFAGGLDGPAVAVATNLAYPLADLLLLGVATLVLALNGWRLNPTWMLLAGAFLLFAACDAIYLWGNYQGTYVAGGPVDLGWIVAGLLCARAALEPAPARRASAGDGHRMLVAPAASGLVALGMLVYGNFRPLNQVAIVLASLCLVAVIGRMTLTFAQSRRESLTDSLTGLPNRRRLTRDLRDRAAAARTARPVGLVILDLNGFKSYNDRFGHPAGDALLARLGRRLADAVGDEGTAYRMGGDEFCALLSPRRASIDELAARAAAALAERGEAFAISAAHGVAILPAEAGAPEAALRLADERMYRAKHGDQATAEHQAGAALLQVILERDPLLGDHSDGVAELAVATGRRLGLTEPRLRNLVLAARLHDIGKVAVPDEILIKAGPLTDEEWLIMRRHPTVGERILNAAPALADAGPIVRASHERMDGGGYPDGLAGEEIPVEARVIAVCDAFDAIISQRPYSARRTPDEAARELRTSAGGQFDPAVVEAFLAELDARAQDPTVPRGTAGVA